jgi:hypothetical protein
LLLADARRKLFKNIQRIVAPEMNYLSWYDMQRFRRDLKTKDDNDT